MLKIAICDDQMFFREIIRELVSQRLKCKGAFIKIDTFSSGKALIETSNIGKYHIAILDIDMKEIDGINTAKRIREVNKEAFIVFITSFINYSLEGYKVNAIRYILKDAKTLKKEVYECMDAILEQINPNHIQKTFPFNNGEKMVRIDRIIYIESNLHRLDFHVDEEGGKIYSLYSTLNKLETEFLGYPFIRTHQSYFINLGYIESVKNYKVELKNGQMLPIPKARYRTVKEKFILNKESVSYTCV